MLQVNFTAGSWSITTHRLPTEQIPSVSSFHKFCALGSLHAGCRVRMVRYEPVFHCLVQIIRVGVVSSSYLCYHGKTSVVPQSQVRQTERT